LLFLSPMPGNAERLNALSLKGMTMKIELHVGDGGNLGKLAMMFPRTFEAKRLIGEAGTDEWKVAFDPAEEAKGVMGATAFILDTATGAVEIFNPHVKQDGPSLDHLADLVAMAEDPFRWMGTRTGRTSCDTPNHSNEAAEDYDIAKDAVDRWADVDFEGLERRVMALKQLKTEADKVNRWNKNRKFAKAYGAADPDRQADKDLAQALAAGVDRNEERDALEEVLEANWDRLDALAGKIDAVQDNAEDNLGRIRDLEAKTKDRVNELFKHVEKLGRSKHDPDNVLGWNGEQFDAMGEQVNRLTKKMGASVGPASFNWKGKSASFNKLGMNGKNTKRNNGNGTTRRATTRRPYGQAVGLQSSTLQQDPARLQRIGPCRVSLCQ